MQLKLFTDLPTVTAPEAPEVLLDRLSAAPAPASYHISYEILVNPDQVNCAQTLVERFPDATKEELVAIIDQCEPAVLGLGCENLSVLRSELERVHPAWAVSSR